MAPDPEITTTYGRIQLVFTRTDDWTPENFKHKAERRCHKLRDYYKKHYNLETLEPEITSNIINGMCETIECTLTLLIEGTKMWRNTLGLLAATSKKLDKFYGSDETLKQLEASLLVQDRIFFHISKLQAADLVVPTGNVYFGNLFSKHIFVTHHLIDHASTNDWYGKASLMRKYYGHVLGVQVKSKHTIYTDFEHDRHELTIGFPLQWQVAVKSSEVDEKGEEIYVIRNVEAIAKLKLNYNAIRRILCDLSHIDERKLIVYLHVLQPPLLWVMQIQRRDESGQIKEQTGNLYNVKGDRELYWLSKDRMTSKNKKTFTQRYVESPYIKLEFNFESLEKFVNILGRMSAIMQKPIEIRKIEEYQPGKYYIRHLDSPFKDARLSMKTPFECRYLMAALISRGAHVKDQLLLEEAHRERFIELVDALHDEDRVHKRKKPLLAEALERLLRVCDESIELSPLPALFEMCIEYARADPISLEDADVADGYVALRKVTITPTRRIYEAPELIMGNRVLRADEEKYAADKFLRIQFRDDDWTRIVPNVGKQFIRYFVSYPLIKGIEIGDRKFNYLGSSNSQMREQGCYFIAADDAEIVKFRELLGEFTVESVPKYMARFGQCFTQSLAMGKPLTREKYTINYDYKGGEDTRGKEYTYSDGVGCISMRMAKEVAQAMKLGDCIPSCFQTRFRGFKGVVSVNPNMDAIHKYLADNERDDSDTKVHLRYKSVDFWFRPSQCKFNAPSENAKYEVVKISGPSPVSLNRPLINILDQVGQKQGEHVHRQIRSRVVELLDIQLRNIASTMCDEVAARNRLGEFPRIVAYDQLATINLTTEPFFRSMLRMAARCTLKKLRTKIQIAIPTNLGRSMLGVVDDTGQLGYGEVFIRYTVDAYQKHPGRHNRRQTLTGSVLVTKNPMIVGGDVRMFTAVDLPALHHMCDVIVFPHWGPRPHPDEMAGSDLDGDEYCVIWDRGLYFDANEAAFDYTSEPQMSDPVDDNTLKNDMIEFFVNYMSNDAIGKLANAFLIDSDIYGIEHKVCLSVAKKHQAAVDFPKTGVSAPKLERGTDGAPNEDPIRRPDFMEQMFKPQYTSDRLNGQLFRLIKEVDEMLQISVEDDLKKPPQLDKYLCAPVEVEYMQKAKEAFTSYKASMTNMLQRFGIGTEIEVFSNSYTSIRRRIGDKDEDDMSYFNTTRLIEDEIERIFSRYRKAFFETYGESFERLTELPRHLSSLYTEKEARKILRCTAIGDMPQNLMSLAAAYYQVAYTQQDQHHLSFAWLAADVLYKVRNHNLRTIDSSPIAIVAFSYDPLSDFISEQMDKFLTDERVNAFRAQLRDDASYTEVADTTRRANIRRINTYHRGLRRLVCYVYAWIEQQGCFPRGSPNVWKTCFLFYAFGLRLLPQQVDAAFLEIPPKSAKSRKDSINLLNQHGGLGRKFLNFLRFLSSIQFSHVNSIKIPLFSLDDKLDNDNAGGNNAAAVGVYIYDCDAIKKLHKSAMLTYYQLCFMSNANVLPRVSDEYEEPLLTVNTLPPVEGRSFICEAPSDEKTYILGDEVQRRLKQYTGCTDIFMRCDRYNERESTLQLIITMSGSLEATAALQKFMTPKLDLRDLPTDFKESQLADYLARQVLENCASLTGRKLRPPPFEIF